MAINQDILYAGLKFLLIINTAAIIESIKNII